MSLDVVTPERPRVEENPAKLTVRSIFSKSGKIQKEDEEVREIELPRMDPEAPQCTVSVDKSITKNLGHYNSLKVGAFISVPCYMDDAEIENAQAFANDTLDECIKRILTAEGLTNDA